MYYSKSEYLESVGRENGESPLAMVLVCSKTNRMVDQVRPIAGTDKLEVVKGGLSMSMTTGLLEEICGKPTEQDAVEQRPVGPLYVISETDLRAIRIAQALLSVPDPHIRVIAEQLMRAQMIIGYAKFLELRGVGELPATPTESLRLFDSLGKDIHTRAGAAPYRGVGCMVQSDLVMARASAPRWAANYQQALSERYLGCVTRAREFARGNPNVAVTSEKSADPLEEKMDERQKDRNAILGQARATLERYHKDLGSVAPRELLQARATVEAILPLVVADRFSVAAQHMESIGLSRENGVGY